MTRRVPGARAAGRAPAPAPALAGALALALLGVLAVGCAKKAAVVRPTREACQEAFIHVGVSQARAAGMPEETAQAVEVAARQVIAGDVALAHSSNLLQPAQRGCAQVRSSWSFRAARRQSTWAAVYSAWHFFT